MRPISCNDIIPDDCRAELRWGDFYTKVYSFLYGQKDMNHQWSRGKSNHDLDSLKLYCFERLLQEYPRQSLSETYQSVGGS